MSRPSATIGSFETTLEDVSFGVSSPGGGFTLAITIQIVDIEAGRAAGVLKAYGPDDGCIAFTFSGGRGLYEVGGIPSGSTTVDQNRCEGVFQSVYVDGLDYRQRFTGSVRLAEGRAEIEGQIGDAFGTDGGLPVAIEASLDTDAIDWRQYTFTSLDEAGRAPVEIVRGLELTDPTFATVPDELARLRSLTRLSIRAGRHDGSPLPFRDLSRAVEVLTSLEQLVVQRATLRTIPVDIGGLTRLRRLQISECQLRETPSSLWALSCLELLDLSGNHLETIPDDVTLPALTHLQLQRNRLTTLPTSLAQQPSLRRIDLTKNPLVSVPDAVRDIETVEIDMEARQRLLRVAYPGEEREYPNDAYLLDPDRRTRLDALLDEAEVTDERVRRFAHAASRPAVGFWHTHPTDYGTVGEHRFGGMPDLPAHWDYPRFTAGEHDHARECVYEFIGQVDCDALAPLQDYLPRTGLVYVFLTTLHDLYGALTDRPVVRVLHYDGPRESLLSGSRFAFTADDYVEMVGAGYTGYSVEARPITSLAPSYPLHQNAYLVREALAEAGFSSADEALDAGYDGLDEIEEVTADYEGGGFGFSQHELPEMEVAARIGGDPADWLTLFTIRSSGDMQWGDAGDLYVLIHKTDLAHQDFSRVQAAMYSS